ncbi:hypothetical protein [Cohnella faecalis]|uniref:hypothetical protein n=1 Tax=Cohnella faecalis TaxID=2315694 RepID=UPI000E5AA047|nr:hypothetical protein [Cohnella faecalis]
MNRIRRRACRSPRRQTSNGLPSIDLHNEGVAGNAEAVKEADREFERLRRDCPGNPVADAFTAV